MIRRPPRSTLFPYTTALPISFRRRLMPERLLPSLIGLTLAVTLTGCGDNGPPAGPPLAAAHPVQGKITFSDQTPLKGGVIYFAPTEIDAAGRVRYEAAGLFDGTGK